MSIGSQKTDNR